MKKIINSSTGKFEPELTDNLVLDAVPTLNSFNPVTSDGVARAVAGASGEVPQVTESDNGKVLKAVYDAGGAGVEWGNIEAELPAYTSEDAGKVLQVQEDGTLAWVLLESPVAPDNQDVPEDLGNDEET